MASAARVGRQTNKLGASFPEELCELVVLGVSAVAGLVAVAGRKCEIGLLAARCSTAAAIEARSWWP